MTDEIALSDIPDFLNSFTKYFSIDILDLKKLNFPKMKTSKSLDSELVLNIKENYFTVNEDSANQFAKEWVILAGWIGFLKKFVSEGSLILNLACCFVYESIEETKTQWLEYWRKVSLIYGVEILTYATWKESKHSDTNLSEDLVELLKMALKLQIKLSKGSVIKYLDSLMMDKFEAPNEDLFELIGLILTKQSDNATELVKLIQYNPQSYTTITRRINTIFDNYFVFKRALPKLDTFGFIITHVIISCTQEEYSSKDQPSNPWLFGFVKGYGTGLYRYFICVTPNTLEAQEYWKKLSQKYQRSEKVKIMQKYKETEYMFSKEFWADNKANWSYLNYVLNDLAEYANNSILSDETLEKKGRKINTDMFDSNYDELKTINAILQHGTTKTKIIANTLEENTNKTRERIKKLVETNKIQEYFFPGFLIVPELVYLLINTTLVSYDNLKRFFRYLPYVGEETCIELQTGGPWRLIYLYTKTGKTDEVLNSIVINFTIDEIIIIRPQLRLGSYWQIPLSLFDQKTKKWTYEWEELSKLMNV